MSLDENQSIWKTYFSDGPIFLSLTGLALMGSGAFALFLTFTNHFLPHDSIHLGYTANELALLAPNLVKFMFHDRAAFGGALLSMGIIYLWLAVYPLRGNQPWAWCTFLISGIFGFGSFLSYIGYGYLDTWHGLATLVLAPLFILGLVKSKPRSVREAFVSFSVCPFKALSLIRERGLAYAFLFLYTGGLVLGGVSILAIGMTSVFVPQDIEFIQLCGSEISDLSPHLIPVIAHDRAGFGGGLLTTGITLYLVLLNANFSRSLRQTIMLSGATGFTSAIGIHFYVGYTDLFHLSPALVGAFIFCMGISLSRKTVTNSLNNA